MGSVGRMPDAVQPRDWDAATYTQVAGPQFRWAGRSSTGWS
jgi:hypothetical protein